MEFWDRWHHLYSLERAALSPAMLFDHISCVDGLDFHQNAPKLDNLADSRIFEYLGFDRCSLSLWTIEHASAVGKRQRR